MNFEVCLHTLDANFKISDVEWIW